MILYVLIALIIIGYDDIILLDIIVNLNIFSNCKKRELHNNIKKTLKSMNTMLSGISHKKSTFRTCYPTGSADVGNCFDDLPVSKADGVYITSVHVGSKSCPHG